MKGFPKYLNTKEDYEYIRANFSEDQWKPAWQKLLDEQKNWYPTGDLASKEVGLTDDTHRISEEQQTDGTVKYIQLEYQDDPGCKLARLGMTKDYVEKVLAG